MILCCAYIYAAYWVFLCVPFIFTDNNLCRILSFNVNGLNAIEKLAKIKQRFLFPEDNSQIPDIYSFQETKSTPDVEVFWNSALPGKIAYSHDSRNSGGVLLGIHP